jgi:hypothetical protein
VSAPEHPGFGILADEPPRTLVVGAIGKVWKSRIPFLHVAPDAYAAFSEPDWVKVAWSIDVRPLGEHASRVVIEVRVDATDDRAWKKFRRYFRVIGIGSHFIRRSLLDGLAREHGTPQAALPGDDRLADARAQVTDDVTIARPPRDVWPWLLQLGCRRGGFYSWDVLDNASERSAREVHEELQHVEIGDVIPATPKGSEGFEVLAIEPNRALVLGGLYDVDAKRQLPFAGARPDRYWHVTWTFVLEPVGEDRTRLVVRGRAAFPNSVALHALWTAGAHRVMQAAELRHLKERVEGRTPRDDWRDVLEAAEGASRMIGALVTPGSRHARSRWGVSEEIANRIYPGDEAVPSPRWSWTHGIEIDASAADVWPWVAQLGADRGGFYSYQFLENVIGCDVRNAESIHAEWAHHTGDELVLHPKGPNMPVRVEEGRYLLGAEPNVASWLVLVEALAPNRCRVISRFRAVRPGAALMEPISFPMDRRMLLGIKERAERRARTASRGLDRLRPLLDVRV